MLKKLALIFLICSIATFGFAQKSKQKAKAKSPKSIYFEMLIDGNPTPKDRYCPFDTILFTFEKKDLTVTEYSFEWYNNFSQDSYFTDSIQLAFPTNPNVTYPNVSAYNVYLRFEIPTDTIPIRDTITTTIYVDYIRTQLDTTVCEGREITVSTTTHGDITFTDVHSDVFTQWDTLPSATGCDSLVRWHIAMDPYIIEEYEISSCDSVIWGDIIVKRPPDVEGDYEVPIERVFFAKNQETGCDTLKILTVTIIDTAQLTIVFDQDAFCNGDDTKGKINLETNFTAFDWRYIPDIKYQDKDSTYTKYKTEDGIEIDIDYSGWYYVFAYMDTTLYEILDSLLIVNNCGLWADTLVKDCDLIIPNVFTPDGDGMNDYFGIKKLNPNRENDLTIYDRWGKNVFHQKNYQCVFKEGAFQNTEEAFDGFSRGGQELQEGTYYYVLKYDAIPKAKTYTGALLLLRKK
jgi:gliding motility-associated-like protein